MGSKDMVVAEPVGAGEGEQALISRESSGVMGLAFMGDKDFDARLVALKKGQERVRLIQRELMEKDEDYGIIPGTPKPTLLKPGAEKLCNVYGLVAAFEETTKVGDGVTEPTLRVRVTCFLHRGTKDGPVVAEGSGAANSWEKKHRYRSAERTCPACELAGTIRRSKFPDKETGDKGWYCFAKAGGCGVNFHSEDPAITEQQLGQVQNPDPYDVENTLVKMATKRAYVDATLRATATSGLFTQDLEDEPGGAGPEPAGGSPPAAPAPARAAQPRHAPPPEPTPRASVPPPPTAQVNGAGKWHGPCPRCGKVGTVIKSKFGPDWVCWASGTKGGCGYKFGPDDIAVHEGAESKRQAHGQLFDEREPGEDRE